MEKGIDNAFAKAEKSEIEVNNNEWSEVPFYKILVEESISYGIVQPGPETNKPDSVPVIRVNNISDGRIDATNVKRVAKSVEEKYKRTRLEGGELLITVVGTVGDCAIVPKELKGFNVARAVSVARIKNEYDIEFVKYSFKTEDVIYQIYGKTNDTVQPTLNLSSLKSLKLSFPPLSEQKAIANVLSSLDTKINLLHRQNKTLEELAEVLYRKWFIEEAKESWEEESLSSVATFLNGLACQKYPPKNEIDKLPVLKIKELKAGFTDNSDWVSTEVDEKYFVQSGDVIFSWSASLVVKIWDGEDCILNQHLFKVTSERFPKWFYYLWSKYHLDMFIAIAKAHATTMGHIKRGDLDDAMVVIPPPSELTKMNKIFSPLIDKIIANNQQIKKVEKLRDTLLPKLMCGEVRVKQ